MKPELKPCPFCGEAARLSYGNNNGDLFVIAMCSSCGIRTHEFYYAANGMESELSEAEFMVAKRWNRRVDNLGIIETRKVIHEMPTIEVRPEVKCEYCQHYFPLVKGGICKILRTEVTDEDFCSLWDKKGEERHETN